MAKRHGRPRKADETQSKTAAAIVAVGGGRGFVVQGANHPSGGALVVTAAHCLPFVPPPHPFSFTKERTYEALLGPLGRSATVWAECLFVNPIADLAVLGPPDSEARYHERRPMRS
jgi:hypothetical protein